MREGPEGTIAYWTRAGKVQCTRCVPGETARGAEAVLLHTQEAGESPLYCSRCARAVGNRLSTRALDAIVQKICAYDALTDDEAMIDRLVDGYADTILDRTSVDLLLKEYDWSLCLSEPDRQRRLMNDLGECAMAGEGSRAVDRVAEDYRIVAAPGGLRRELEGRGYEAEQLGEHQENVRKAIWELAYEQEFGGGSEREEESDAGETQIALRVRWRDGQHEKGRRLAINAWRTIEQIGASTGARVLAQGRKVWVGKRQRTEDGGSSLRCAWDGKVDEDEKIEMELGSEVPRRIAEGIERVCTKENAEIECLRTVHEMTGTSVLAEIGWGGGR